MTEDGRAVDASTRFELVALALILAMTVVLFRPGLDFPFVYDDVKQIAENPRVNAWSGLTSGFTEGVWSFDETKADRYYRPVFSSVLTLCQMLSSGSPRALHVASLLLHLVNVLLLWRIARSIDAPTIAGLTACGLFALHPIQIQAVVWASAISDPLTTTLGFAALLGASRWRRDGRVRDSLWIAAFFALACLTLERAFFLALPLLLWLHYEPARDGGSWARPSAARLARYGAPIAAPIAIALALRMSASGNASNTVALEVGDSLLTIPSVVARYLANVIFPARLSLAYPERMLSEVDASGFVLPLVVCVATAACLLYASRESARRQLLLACFVSMMALPLWVGVLPGYALVQDRYLYLPLAFLFLWVGDALASSWTRFASPGPRRAIVAGLAIAGLLVVALHGSNLRFWRSEVALYQRCTETAPDNPLFLMNLSNALTRARQPQTSCELLARAVAELESDPRRGAPALAHFSLGNCLRRRGELPAALVHYGAAQRYGRGSFPQAHENAAVTLLDLGDDGRALVEAEVLIDRWPDSATGYKLAGIVFARRGDFERAAEMLARARERDPESSEIQSLARRVEGELTRPAPAR